MILISLQGWTRMLYVTLEDNGQPWFAEFFLDCEKFPHAPSYTYEKILDEWKPPSGVRQ